MRKNSGDEEEKDSGKARLSVTLDPEVAEGIRMLAEEDERSVSSYINRVLKRVIREAGK